MARSEASRSFIPPLTMSFEMNDAKNLDPSATASGVPPFLEMRSEISESDCRHAAARLLHELGDRVSRAFSQSAAVDVDAAHSRIGGERNELRFVLGDFAAAQAVFLLGQHDDRAPLGRFVGKAGQLSGICQFAFVDSVDRYEFDRLPIAQSDGSGLVQKQRVYVAGSLHRLSAHGQNVVLHHAIHARDADRGEQSADGRRNQADQQGNENRNGRGGAAADRLDCIFRIGRQRRDRQQENQRQAGNQDIESDFIRRLLAHRAFDQRDHAVQERLARIRGDPDLDVIRQAPSCRRSPRFGRLRIRE